MLSPPGQQLAAAALNQVVLKPLCRSENTPEGGRVRPMLSKPSMEVHVSTPVVRVPVLSKATVDT